MYTHAWLFIVDVACIAVIFTASCASAAATRWWPAFPLPNRLYVLEDQGSYARQVAAETLAGLLARRDRLRGPGPMIWLDQGNPDYTRWLRMFLARHKVPETRHPGGLWTLVRKFHRAGIVRGYILYNPGTKDDPHDLSVNWATSLCGPMGGIAVDASQQAEAKRVGLPMLADARGKDFAWMLAKLHHRYTRRQLCLLQPGQPNLRDEAVAAGALTTLDVPGGGYRHALSLMQPGGIVFGWGVSEYNSVMMAS